MAVLLDLHPDTGDAVSSGVADLHGVIDRLHTSPLASSSPGTTVAEVDRAIRRLESLKLKLVAAADKAGTARDAGFTGPDAWLAKTTTVSRGRCGPPGDVGQRARDRAQRHRTGPRCGPCLARTCCGDRPRQRTTPHRRERGAAPGRGRRTWWSNARRYSPDQLRRLARRAIEAVEPDQTGRRRPRERAGPLRGTSRPGQLLAHVCMTTGTAPLPATSPSPLSQPASWPR